MKLFQLKYFVTAAKTGSITAAAENMKVSQPSITYAIKDLEKEFGVKLFDRFHHGIVLTHEGGEFYKMATGLLQHAESVADSMNTIHVPRKGLNVGIHPSVSGEALVSLYSGLRSSFPELNLSVLEKSRCDLIKDFANDVIDLALIPDVGKTPEGFEYTHLVDFDMIYIVPDGHPLCGRASVTWDEILEYPLIIPRGTFFEEYILKPQSELLGKVPEIIMRLAQAHTICSFVRSGLGTSFLYSSTAESFSGIRGINVSPSITIHISLVRKKRSYVPNDLLSIIEYIKGKSWI